MPGQDLPDPAPEEYESAGWAAGIIHGAPPGPELRTGNRSIVAAGRFIALFASIATRPRRS
jgi:hypothetical protein